MKCWMKELHVNEKLEKMWDDENVACFIRFVLAFACRFRLLFLVAHTYIKITSKCALCLHVRAFLSICYWVLLLIVSAHLVLSTFTSTSVPWLSCCRTYTIFSHRIHQSLSKPEPRLVRTILGHLQHSISHWNYYYSVSPSPSPSSYTASSAEFSP